MIMTRVLVIFSLVSFFSSTTSLMAQGNVVISDVKPSNRSLSFALENIGRVDFELDPAVSFQKGKYVPIYHFFRNDTLNIDLRTRSETLNVGGRQDIDYYIDGYRRNKSKIIHPNSKMYFYIPKNKMNKIHAITVIIDENWTLTTPVQ